MADKTDKLDPGFTYKTVFVWCKQQLGVGNYFRTATEFLLLGVRGRLRFRVRDQINYVVTPRTKRHSDKPDEVRRIVERCSHAPRLELFARPHIATGR